MALVLLEREGAVVVVTLNRPEKLNALSEPLMTELVSALEELDADPEVRCILLAGSDKAFAAGADVAELAAFSGPELYAGRRVERWDALRRVRTPLVAAVSGFCLGGGCELALACDLILASETAVFGQPETGLGIIPGAGGTQRLARAAGKALAMDVVLTGRRLSAEEARSAGLVARVLPAASWLADAKAVTAEIAAKAPLAQRLAAESIDRAFESPLTAGLDYERRSLELTLATDDAQEGLQAFLEKREPRFEGR